MAQVDSAILQRDFPISHALLTHDDLMTRVLIRHFGAVHAVQTAIEEDADSLTRWSTLYQTETDTPLLQATLVIRKAALPVGFLGRLLAGRQLFGGLLIEAGISVRVADRTLYRAGPPDGVYSGSWGRRQHMLRAADDVLLSDVDECLASEATLRRMVLAGGRHGLETR